LDLKRHKIFGVKSFRPSNAAFQCEAFEVTTHQLKCSKLLSRQKSINLAIILHFNWLSESQVNELLVKNAASLPNTFWIFSRIPSPRFAKCWVMVL